MRRLLLHILLLGGIVALGGVQRAAAQYYSWGSDAATLRWESLRTPDVRVIYPDTARSLARRTMFYIETVHPEIGWGFRHGPLRIPFVLHPENFQSNGLVMWLPKRVDFLTTPAIEGYSMPWIKQLVAHEYRHAVQYNNINRGLIRCASWLLGQQGSVIGLLFMPVWSIEGDAVLSETSMSSFGRGLQPRFTLEYRAMGNFVGERRNPDKWFCGSYRDVVPDHYQLGYQINSYAYNRYGENIWNKVVRYSVRNPYLIFANTVALRKFYGTSERWLFRETFVDLINYWASLPQLPDSAEPMTDLDPKNYTTYRWPLPLDDSTVLALRSDYDHPDRFVRIDRRTGHEKRVAYTGAVSTRPTLAGGRVWWTEYRRSLLFDQRVHSQLCYMDLDEGRPRTWRGARSALYPVVVGDSLPAWVEYRPDGVYTIVRTDARDGVAPHRLELPAGQEIHGLAWDDRTEALYVLVTDDSGMWPGRVGATGIEPLRDGAYVTLSDLRADDGVLYFGSIASGRDEVHALDLTSGVERRLTTSTYGSFSPAPDGPGRVLVTNYARHGFRVATQRIDSARIDTVAFARLPRNVVNPPRPVQPRTINLDTVRFTPADSAASYERHKARRYRRGLTLVKPHSWMPVALDPFALFEEQGVWFNLGATLLSQNLLSNAEGFVAYGWNRSEGSLIRGRFRYTGLGVQFDINGSYGGNQVVYALAQTDPETGVEQYQKIPSIDRYWSVGATATLPLYLQRGYHTRQLSFSAGWNYSNGMVARVDELRFDSHTGLVSNLENVGFNEGLHRLTFGVGWSDFVRSAHRDLTSPWGYVLRGYYVLNPVNRNFSDLVSAYGRVYTPGLLPHHSFSLAAIYQTSIGGYRLPSGRAFLSYQSSQLLPRGVNASEVRSDHYTGVSLDYLFPVGYPEGGISGVVYVKRISINLGGDFAQFRRADALEALHGKWQRIWSLGGDVIVDVNFFRQPASGTTSLKFSIYKPTQGSVWFGVGVGMPF